VVLEAFTTSTRVPALPVVKFESPLYPALRLAPELALVKTYVHLATPALMTTWLQRVVLPWLKVMAPEGSTSIPPADGVIVAVRVTDWLTDGETGEEVSTVCAGTLLTVSVVCPGAATTKFVSPV